MSSRKQPDRRSHRLPEYDYSQPGAYFVTILVKDRQCIFGEIFDGDVHLSAEGKIVEQIWKQIPQHHENVELDVFVVMPNHLHGIIWLIEDKDTRVRAQHGSM